MSIQCIDTKPTNRYILIMKTSQLQIRVSPEQKKIIRKAADRANMDMSEWVLKRIFPSPRSQFLDILLNLKSRKDEKDHHYILNDLNAFLAGLSRDELKILLAEETHIKLNEFLENYIAAMIEQACVMKNLPIPNWLARIAGLTEPYFGSDLFSLRLYLLTSSPPSFRKRNIFIDATVGNLV